MERTIRECVGDVKRAPYVEAAEGRIVEHKKDQQTADTAQKAALTQLDAEGVEAETSRQRDTEAADARLEQQRAEQAKRREALMAQVAEARTIVTVADAEAARTAGAEQALVQAEAYLKAAQQAVSEIDRQAARLEAERDGVAQQQADLARRRAEAAEIQARLRTVEDEGLAWQTLAKALGRDGLQRLELDGAAPVVSDLTNDLLSVGFGTRYQVSLVTEVPTADRKDMKERVAMMVLDQEHGGAERDLGDLSGGERVIVEEAIRAALSIYVNMRSRIRFKTLWRDECSGALSPENVPKYAAMLRRMLQLSGADQCLFVCHQPELADMADAIVHVEDGKVASIRFAA